MADNESAKAKKAAVSLGDKILQNAIAADAAIVIVQKKLLKLSECKLIICTSLKRQMKGIAKSLDPVYDFLTKHPKGSEKREWKSRLLEAIYQMEDGIDVFRSRIALQNPANVNQTIGIGRPNIFLILRAKYLLWRCLQDSKSQITRLKEVEHVSDKSPASDSAKEKNPQNHFQDLTGWERLFDLDFSVNKMAARQVAMKKLKKQMESRRLCDNIVIVGEQGAGKTYLARKVFNQLRDQFDCCAWVNMSRLGVFDEILGNILKQVSVKSSLMPNVRQSSERLIEQVFQALIQKSYLIVLDDACDQSLLWRLFYSIPYSKHGCRLLITTQIEAIAYGFVYDYIKLGKLEGPEIRELVSRKLEITGKALSDELWEKVREAFIKKCHGSPLRLNLLSGWIAKSSDGIADLIESAPDIDDLDHLFTYCYNKMLPELKPCFLYMILFPKGYPIPVRRLLRLWLSEGLLIVPVDLQAKMKPEDFGKEYLKELVILNLIEVVAWKEDGSPSRVRVITGLYDMFCSGATSTELLHIYSQKEMETLHQHQPQKARLRWLAEHSNIQESRSTLSPVAKINHLRSFLSFVSRDGVLTPDIRTFLKEVSGKDFNLLTVLDLEGVYKPSLDKVLGKLVLLKYLGLRSTALDSLPESVANLPYLETLDLKYTNITELPKPFWKKSRNLRHLYLNSYCHINKSILSSSFATSAEPLANLQTFSGVVVDSIHLNTHMQTIEGLSNMKKLTKLGIFFGQHLENQNAIGDWISNLTNLQSLKLGIIESSEPSMLPPRLSLTEHYRLSKLHLLGEFKWSSTIPIPRNLISLTLFGSHMSNDHIVQLGNLTNLKVLNLRANSFTGKSLKFSEGGLPNLLVLRLWKLNELVEIEIEQLKIKTIEFRRCPKMVKIKLWDRKPEEAILLQLVCMQSSFVKKIMEIADERKRKKEERLKEIKEDEGIKEDERKRKKEDERDWIKVKIHEPLLDPPSADEQMNEKKEPPLVIISTIAANHRDKTNEQMNEKKEPPLVIISTIAVNHGDTTNEQMNEMEEPLSDTTASDEETSY